MWLGKSSVLIYWGLFLAAILLSFVGLIWFLTPFQNNLANGYGYLIEYPNWRGLPFFMSAVIVSMTAAIVLRRGQIGRSLMIASLGLLIVGYVSMVAGLVLLFTPRVFDYGGAVLIEYPSASGLPYIALAVSLWIVDGLLLYRAKAAAARMPVSLGLLAAGAISLVLVQAVLYVIGSLIASLLGTTLLHFFEIGIAVVLWIFAAFILWPYRRQARLSLLGSSNSRP